MAPKVVQTLTLESVNMLPYMAKRDFADIEMGRLAKCAKSNHMDL